MSTREMLSAVLKSELRVLVIEDEERYRLFLVDVLGDMGCTAQGAATAAEARTILGHEDIDAIILDLNLPMIDGMTFLQRFRQMDRITPVIILTGVGDLTRAQQAIRLGVTDFLLKPCHLGEIEASIDRARRHLARRTEARDAPPAESVAPADGTRTIAVIEREAISAALREHGGNRSAAAAALGISRRTLYNRIEQYRNEGHELRA
ncbi:MAG: response regulator [Phycisphaerales bacterium]|nr:response regulator [Phycisphaerales bacterium]